MSRCFSWGGKNWGGSHPGWEAFAAWLRAHGDDETRWILNHPNAAACIGAPPVITTPAPTVNPLGPGVSVVPQSQAPPVITTPAPPANPLGPGVSQVPQDQSPPVIVVPAPPTNPLGPGVSSVPSAPATGAGGGPSPGAGTTPPALRDPTRAAMGSVVIPSYVVPILNNTGMPDTLENRVGLALWGRSEGMSLGYSNPLAATDVPYGEQSDPINSDGVQRYPSIVVASAIYAVKWRSEKYRAIGDAFRAGNDIVRLFVAINSSPWCEGCQGGEYPSALYELVNKTGHGPVATSGGTAGRDRETPSPPIPELVPPSYTDTQVGWSRLMSALGRDMPASTADIMSARNLITEAVN